MKIWIDADSCPRQVRETICRAAIRTGIRAIFVANKKIQLTKDPNIDLHICPQGPDEADNYIVEHAKLGDLAVTRDVPLAARLVENCVDTLNDRGTVYTKENIRERLSVRDFLVSLASDGLQPERIASYNNKDLQQFANAFDRLLQRLIRLNTI